MGVEHHCIERTEKGIGNNVKCWPFALLEVRGPSILDLLHCTFNSKLTQANNCLRNLWSVLLNTVCTLCSFGRGDCWQRCAHARARLRGGKAAHRAYQSQ